jgi:hypothetical protein
MLPIQDQISTAYRNMETVFQYLKHIQVGVDTRERAKEEKEGEKSKQ